MSSDHDNETPDRSRLWRLLVLLGVVAVPLAVVWWPGCRTYPELTSREGMGLMKLLYTACNTRDPVRLGKVEQGVEKAAGEGKLTDREREAFREIIGMARAGDWERAEKASFKFAQDQVR